MTVADYTETAFARSPRLHHKDALEGPSSAGFGKRNLVGLMGVMMEISEGADMKEYTCQEYKQYSTAVADWIDSLGLKGNGFVFVKSMNTSSKAYHFIFARIVNSAVYRDIGFVRLNGSSNLFEGKAFGSSNDGRLEQGAVVAFVKCDIDW